METLLHFTLRNPYGYDEETIKSILEALNIQSHQGILFLFEHGIKATKNGIPMENSEIKKSIEDVGLIYIDGLKNSLAYCYYRLCKTINQNNKNDIRKYLLKYKLS